MNNLDKLKKLSKDRAGDIVVAFERDVLTPQATTCFFPRCGAINCSIMMYPFFFTQLLTNNPQGSTSISNTTIELNASHILIQYKSWDEWTISLMSRDTPLAECFPDNDYAYIMSYYQSPDFLVLSPDIRHTVEKNLVVLLHYYETSDAPELLEIHDILLETYE